MKLLNLFKKKKSNFKESNYYKHAVREFKSLGYESLDTAPDDPDRWIQENVLELLEVLEKQGHSGSSIHYLMQYLNKLALFEPLTPIECTDDEWVYISNECYQNNRLSSVLKDSEKGKPYYLDAIIWRQQSGSCFTGTVEGITSRQNIKIPFVPKSFYIDVESYEVNKETGEREIGSGWWESKIVKPNQLKEVWKYYERPKNI